MTMNSNKIVCPECGSRKLYVHEDGKAECLSCRFIYNLADFNEASLIKV